MNIFSGNYQSNNQTKIKLMKIFILIAVMSKNKLKNRNSVFLGIRAEDIMPVDKIENSKFWSFKKYRHC